MEAIRAEATSPRTPVAEGELVRISCVFTDLASGAAVDPPVVRFLFVPPGEARKTLAYGTDSEVVRSAAGAYHVDLSVDGSGVWPYRWESEEKVGIAEGQVTARASAVGD
jgi:hypothetical protein